MARIRSLKIGFFKNEELAALSAHHRLLFEGLWLIADREGRLEDRPRRIKAELFPYESLDVDPMLTDLHNRNFITRYTADGAGYIAVAEFRKHQRPKSDEPVSVIPAPVSANPRGVVAAPLLSPLGKDRETEDRETEGGEGIGADVAPPAADGADPHLQRASDFAEAWNRITEPPIARCRDLTSARKRKIRTRLTERPLPEWETVMARIQASSFCRGDNDRGWCASFDWLIGSPDVAVKVLEGKYDDRRGRVAPPTADERQRAERFKKNVWMGRCRHDPACASHGECIVELVAYFRGESVAS
jgi:hypothetical protein